MQHVHVWIHWVIQETEDKYQETNREIDKGNNHDSEAEYKKSISLLIGFSTWKILKNFDGS